MSDPTLVEAARNALAASMNENSSVVVLGEDVTSGGPFGLTKGLAAAFGTGRVRNTPISESSIMGVGVGLALSGARPVIDIMFNDFLTLASDQLFNHAAKIRYMSGGRQSVPLVVWTVAGAGTRWGAQHSQRLDGWLTQFPGLKVLAPASPSTAAASLRAAIGDPDPVLILVDRALLYSRGDPANDQIDPWSPRLVKLGDELTIVSTGRLVHLACDVLASSSVSADVIDLQRLAPLNVDLVCESIRKTGRVLILHDEAATAAFSALVLRAIQDQAFWYLDGPIVWVSATPTPVPAGPELEDAHRVGADQILVGIQQAIHG